MDRLLAWIRKDWIYELTKIKGNTVAGAETLAISLIQTSFGAHAIWTARCRAIHDEDGNDPIDRIKAGTQYEQELNRTGKTQMPISLRNFLKEPNSQRDELPTKI